MAAPPNGWRGNPLLLVEQELPVRTPGRGSRERMYQPRRYSANELAGSIQESPSLQQLCGDTPGPSSPFWLWLAPLLKAWGFPGACTEQPHGTGCAGSLQTTTAAPVFSWGRSFLIVGRDPTKSIALRDSYTPRDYSRGIIPEPGSDRFRNSWRIEKDRLPLNLGHRAPGRGNWLVLARSPLGK